MLITKYKFNNTLYDLFPEFNSGFEFTYTDEVNGEVTTRTIESDSSPTMIRFGRVWVEGESSTDNRTDSLLEVLDMNTNGLTSCSNMFRYCQNLTSIICEWNTSNVTSMYAMFHICKNLTTLDVSNFNTSNVTTMYGMFSGCTKLTTLDISNFNTSKVTNMSHMFYDCNKLTSLDVSNWNTSSVTDITNIFTSTPLLTDIGMLYCNASTIQKIINAMPIDLNKTLWYKEANIDNITYSNNITLKKYIEENIEIVLNSPLLEGDTIEIVDGKLCHVHRWGKTMLDGSENWQQFSSDPNNLGFNYMTCTDRLDAGKRYRNILCDKFKAISNSNYGDQHKLYEYNQILVNFNESVSNYLYISTEFTINELKTWLSENPTTLIYELVEPTYENVTPLQSELTLKTFEECNVQVITALPIKTKITYRTNITSAVVLEQELDTLDSGVSLSNLIEEEVDE